MATPSNQSAPLKRWLLPIIILVIAIFSAYSIVASREEPQRKPRPVKPATVSVATLSPQDYAVEIKSNGTVKARTETTLLAQVSGEIVSAGPNYRAGGFFEEGDVLLKIDDRDYRSAVTIATAELRQAQLALEEEKARSAQAQKDYARLGLDATPSDLALRKPQLEGAQAQVAAAKARLDQAQLNLSRCEIRAPYAGRVLAQSVDVGQVVSSGTNLGEIYAIDSVEIRLPISQQQMAWIDLPESYRGESEQSAKNPTVAFSATLGGKRWQWQGEIVRTEGAIDATSRQSFVVAQVIDPYAKSNDGRPPLKVGQFVQASIAGHQIPQALLLPRSALTAEGQFFEVTPDNKLKGHKAEIVWRDSDHFILSNRIEAAINVVTSALPFALDGVPVKPVNTATSSGTKASQTP